MPLLQAVWVVLILGLGLAELRPPQVLFTAQTALPKPANDTTNYAPKWSPDGTRLVFYRRMQGSWGLYITDADGAHVRHLSTDATNAYHPAWSPVGDVIAYDAADGANRDIFTIVLSEGLPRRLTRDASRDVMPTWAPDGREIAYVSDRGGSPQLWAVGIDGARSRRITQDFAAESILRPAWSPDGRWIAFSAVAPGDAGRRRLYIVSQAGGQPRPITPVGDAANPSWSPDSRRLAFDATLDGTEDSGRGKYEIFTVQWDGSNVQQLTANQLNDWAPAWSPDGKEIAFCRGLNNQYEVYRMLADGSRVVRVTRLVYPEQP